MKNSTHPRLLLTGAAAGILLAVAAPLAASAHVTVTPDAATAGDYSVLTFAFSHGCEDSPTTSLAIDVPEGIDALAPQLEPGWTVEAVGADAGIPTRVIYTADTPVENGFRSTVTMQVKFAEDTAGEAVAFPVVQSCVEGETDWVELAADGEDPHELDAPAPLVTVAAASADAHGDGHSSAGAEATAAASTEADPVARWLAAGALVAGLAALAVAVLRGRTRRS
ncbi:YcnI family protein [Planococcus sp. APC 4015]|nr:YcnI family protein [Planococcus sp. APC 4015]